MGTETDEEWVRLLACRHCHSIDEVLDFQGDPGADVILEYATRKHNYPDGTMHPMARLYRMPVKVWERNKEEVAKNIWKDNGYTGLEPETYANINTFKQDAYKCWTDRLKPKRCADFHNESKRLTPPTQQLRRDAGLGKYRPEKLAAGQVRYLCDYCVCRMQVEHEINLKNPSM